MNLLWIPLNLICGFYLSWDVYRHYLDYRNGRHVNPIGFAVSVVFAAIGFYLAYYRLTLIRGGTS